eukprot:scaffold16681_cov152-Isochrysis_galbana.AAC.2
MSTQEQQGPTPTSVDRIKELHQQLKETKNKQAQNTYTAHARTLKEEKSTKEFYQPFKAKHASGDIPELLHTPNWNSPEAKFGTVDTTPQILGEFRGYYSWLTSSRTPKLSVRHAYVANVIYVKIFTDIRVARALHPHQSLPDPSSPPRLLYSHFPQTPNPSPYQPFREGVLGRDASDTNLPNVLAHAHWMRGLARLLDYQSVDVSGLAVCTTSAYQSGLRDGCVVSF